MSILTATPFFKFQITVNFPNQRPAHVSAACVWGNALWDCLHTSVKFRLEYVLLRVVFRTVQQFVKMLGDGVCCSPTLSHCACRTREISHELPGFRSKRLWDTCLEESCKKTIGYRRWRCSRGCLPWQGFAFDVRFFFWEEHNWETECCSVLPLVCPPVLTARQEQDRESEQSWPQPHSVTGGLCTSCHLCFCFLFFFFKSCSV